MIELDLIVFLKANGFTVTPHKIPQRASFPAITFEVVDWGRDYQLSGPSGTQQARIRLVVSSPDFNDCGLVTESLRKLLSKIRYPMSNTFVDACFLENQSTDYSSPIDSSDVGRHTKSSDFVFRYVKTN